MDLNPIYIDFETFYGTDYSLRSMSSKEYVTDARFKVHGVGVAVGDGPVIWLTGADVDVFFRDFPLDQYDMVGHNLAFDAMIVTQRYGRQARRWLDTLGMARAIVGTRIKSLSLDSLGQAFGLGGKLDGGKALSQVKDVRDLTQQQSDLLGSYCIDDVKLTRSLFKLLAQLFPAGEYNTLSWTIDMAVNPMLFLDPVPLRQLELDEKRLKHELVAKTGVKQTDIASNQKFADLLRGLGVEPPVKVSKTTGKETFAFAKNDEKFLDLLEHEDDRVFDLIRARLAVKSTIKETRAHKLLGKSANGLFPVHLNYSGAMNTHRLSGGGGDNVQNMTRGSLLRKALVAPKGYRVIAGDLSQIELRGNCLASGQTDILDELRNKGDVYIRFAKEIYADPSLNKHDNPEERTVGKISELSLGYKSWADTFRIMLRAMANIRIDPNEAIRIVRLYRQTHPMIAQAWKIYDNWLQIMLRGETPYMDHPINLPITLKPDGFVLPSGLEVTYPGLTRYDFDNQCPVPRDYVAGRDSNVGLAYRNERRPGGYAKVHAGVLNNNLIQSVCRDVNMVAAEKIRRDLPDIDPTARMVMSVHDESVVVAREEYTDEVKAMMQQHMRTPPAFWPDLPVDCEVHDGPSYGDVK
ncbi:MAG: hypothetical protein DI640_13050 [Sphingomonas taxi]|uniref:DNA-directed DNA polymerase n=1 Tax=Sphingomonas taxi TaxID=1549858 RepID=A0A2W5AMH6_9SPHN|nr:MAG: hypothetical protein DI640_13050 [Sphingomonas taxi]